MAVKRLSDRAKTDRARTYDTTTELVVNRLEQYNEKTMPVLDYYKKQNKFHLVKGEGTQEEVFDRLSEKVDEIFKTNY